MALTAPLDFQVVSAIHSAAPVSVAEADVEDVTADVIILARDPDLALHRPAASTLKVRVRMGQQGLLEDREATADMEDTSMEKVRLAKGMKAIPEDLEGLADAEEEDTEEDGDTTDVEDLLHSVAQEEWVGST